MKAGETRGRQRLLVVDDDEFVRALFKRILSADRYEILFASDPSTALELAKEGQPPPDLLVTDVVMPETQGPQLYRELAQLWPSLRVLYMSGYPQANLEKQGVTAEDRFLSKPFNPTTLLAAVQGALPSPE